MQGTLKVGLAIKAARKFRRMSQRRLGILVGVSESEVSRVECCRNSPQLMKLELYAAALDTEVWRLVRYAERQARKRAEKEAEQAG